MPGPSVTVVCSFVFRPSISPEHTLGERRSFASSLVPRQGRRPLPLPPAQESELLEQMDVLLVLEQGAMQWRDQFLGVALAQRLRRNVLIEQKLEPVEQL